MIDVPLMAEHFTGICCLHLDQLCVSVLTTVYCTKMRGTLLKKIFFRHISRKFENWQVCSFTPLTPASGIQYNQISSKSTEVSFVGCVKLIMMDQFT